ncbi:hypothetical protein SNE40_000864 [Patella caerulea]|uniref:Uncharacterized protein n=1 Tax=Patella caerulea TaxID=87958 RepID=A0AAN8KBC7_PATCE
MAEGGDSHCEGRNKKSSSSSDGENEEIFSFGGNGKAAASSVNSLKMQNSRKEKSRPRKLKTRLKSNVSMPCEKSPNLREELDAQMAYDLQKKLNEHASEHFLLPYSHVIDTDLTLNDPVIAKEIEMEETASHDHMVAEELQRDLDNETPEEDYGGAEGPMLNTSERALRDQKLAEQLQIELDAESAQHLHDRDEPVRFPGNHTNTIVSKSSEYKPWFGLFCYFL